MGPAAAAAAALMLGVSGMRVLGPGALESWSCSGSGSRSDAGSCPWSWSCMLAVGPLGTSTMLSPMDRWSASMRRRTRAIVSGSARRKGRGCIPRCGSLVALE